MAVLQAILPVAARSSGLSLELYRVAALSSDEAARGFLKVAGTINNFASTLKQIGTIVKEDDQLPSHEAIETLEDLIEQSDSIAFEIESIAALKAKDRGGEDDFSHYSHESLNWGSQMESHSATRLVYLTTHLEALRATLSVLLQTLYTAQSIIWARYRPTTSQQQAEKAVANERLQLEALITEQQALILTSTSTHEQTSVNASRYLMEDDSPHSLVIVGRDKRPSPATLYRYQDRYIASLDKSASEIPHGLLAIRNITSSQTERLLERWTCLPQLDSRLREAEQQTRTQQRESQQPTVESDDEDDDHHRRQKLTRAGKGTSQPLFAEPIAFSQKIPETSYGPTSPMSPAASPRTSRHSLASCSNDQVSPGSGIISLPIEAAAAIEAHEKDEDVDLEIPWQLCTRKYYWKYVDGKIVSSNTHQLPSVAFLERNSWTEIMASWVCKEAIREAGYRVTQVQNDRKDGRRTRCETCFCVERPLQFEQVKRLVERTVEIYRQRKPPSPPSRARRSSFNRPPPPPLKITRPDEIDRDRTPLPSKTHPTLGKAASSMPSPPSMPPPLDRSMSMPGPGFQTGSSLQPNLHIPMPTGPYSTSVPYNTYPAQVQQGPYSPQLHNFPQAMYELNTGTSNGALPPHLQPQNLAVPQSPLRQSYLNPHPRSRHDDDFTASDSDSAKERRRRRSKSRNRHSTDAKKKSHNKSKAAGVLMGVGGLTALLDGLSGL